MGFKLAFASIFFLATAVFLVAQDRVSNGLVSLYDFREEKGDLVTDRVGDLDLKISDSKNVKRSRGVLTITGQTIVKSAKPAAALVDAAKKSQELTIEVWVRPGNTSQEGPARIVSLSKDANERNFTLGQEKDQYDVRFRTSKTSRNGQPTVAARGLTTDLTHVVYVREKSGVARLYLNGEQKGERNVGGNLDPWSGSFHLALGDEHSGGRLWKGSYHLVAVYGRALNRNEVEQNFRAGISGESVVVPVTKVTSKPKVEPLPEKAASGVGRAGRGLQVAYDFRKLDGKVIRDVSGNPDPVDLEIEDTGKVRHSNHVLEIQGKTKINSRKPAARLTHALKESGEVSVEAWIQPANQTQEGPARIISLSRDTSGRSFTLGQEKKAFDMRFKTTATDGNGIKPSVTTDNGTADARLTHVVYTRDRRGRASMFIDGRLAEEQQVDGDLDSWDSNLRLSLANETTGDRPWLGTFHLVAIFDRALTLEEVSRNFKAGSGAPLRGGEDEMLTKNENAQLFETRIAPLIAEHCLECHDTSTREGKLDLSKKEFAFAGGKREGHGVVAGKVEESSIWKSIVDDEMPEDREPLSSDEKALLKQWIEGGASWTINQIDPAVYAHGGGNAEAGKVWIQRLTLPEYIETVRATTGVDITKEARELLPPELRADGFSNTAYNLNVDLKHVGAYSRLAEIIVERMDVEKFAGKYTNSRSLADDKKMKELIEGMGLRLLRGPIDSDEVYAFRGILTTVAAAQGDFKEAAGYLIEAMLQSPRFVYRIEKQQGDGTLWPVSDYELASRLSYILWGGPPDEGLLKAADRRELSSSKKLESEVRRMLEDPRAVARSRTFASEWLNLGRLKNLAPDPKRFPVWNAELADDMRDETLAFFEEVVWKRNRPLSELMNAQVTQVSPQLAKFYGLDGEFDKTRMVDLSGNPERGGLLTQASILTIGGDNASMVSRGLFVMHDLLRGVVKDPPPCVDTTPVPTKKGYTQRSIAEERIKNVSCGGCHAKFEPLAFGLEKYDGIGAFSDTDKHGNPLRSDGNILIPGEAESMPYKTSAELMDLLAASPRVKETITWKLAQFAMGRPLTARDATTVEAIHSRAMENGGTYQATMTAIVTSDLVKKTRTEDDSKE